jgi:hypothetical protein
VLAIKRGSSREEENRKLRADLDEVREESRKLRERLAALEAQSGRPGPGEGGSTGER